MQFARINRSLPEKIFINVYNADTVAIGATEIATWKVGLTEATGAGVHVIQSAATANMQTVAGVAVAAIAAATYGLIQIYGLAAVKSGAATQVTHTMRTGGTTAGVGVGVAVDTSAEASMGPVITSTSGGVALVLLRLM